uniref:ATP synthase subunit b, chloroplastic n=1 Tax=Sykidion marinum TaxID=44573 RepID=A0A1W6EGM5_SYKMA|nr:CF0 subunit I of ATP synthase [Pseudoneochloris marina]ARK14536.1 CF0 subunit I of ATP synthase [Pseudoneochloris marina]
MNFIDISLIFSGHGFGFNTNILETNVINLAVVIAVVISFVGDAVRELLNNRKETILNNLREADARALEAQEKLNQAKAQLELAQKKATEIREQGLIAAEQEKKLCIQQAEEDAARLKQGKQDTIRLQQQKAIQQISQQIVSLALQQVRDKLRTGANARFHISVNDFKSTLFKSSLLTSK